MRMHKKIAICLTVPLLVLAFGASAESLPLELEFGYRWVDVGGNEDMYRTQIDEEEGLLVRSFSLLSESFDGERTMFDHFRIDAADLGSGPASMLRIEAGKSSLYNLRFRYSDADAYSALPVFANPLLGQGIIPGQHTFERERVTYDVDVDILAWKRFTPFVGYTSHSYDGPGTTTYHVGQDEFLLSSNLDESEDEFRAGFSFNFDNFYGQVTQGWRSFDSDESLTLSGPGVGNNPGTVLGEPVEADQISRNTRTEVDTPFTNIYVAGRLGDRVKLVGHYVTLDADLEGSESESLSGSFVSFPLARYFSGLMQQTASSAETKATRAGVRAELRITDRVDLFAGYRNEEREMSGGALINSLYIDSITFGGLGPDDLEVIMATAGALVRDQDVFDAGISARNLGHFSFWAGYSETQQDVNIDEDLLEIVVPGSQEGVFDRKIKTIDAGGSFVASGLTVTAAYRTDDADDAILRTDFLDRTRNRVRASWKSANGKVHVGLMGEFSDQDNKSDGIGYDGESTNISGDFEFSPTEAFSLRGSYSSFEADSVITIRKPSTFETTTSIHNEDGESIECGLSVFYKPLSLLLDFGQFTNEGSNPFEMDRIRTRVVIDLVKNTGIALEWARDDYQEAGGLGNFDADRYGLYIRWTLE